MAAVSQHSAASRNNSVRCLLSPRPAASLATIRKINTALGSVPGSFDPSQATFRRDNAALQRQMEVAVAQPKKSYPKARATDDAIRLAEKYGLSVP